MKQFIIWVSVPGTNENLPDFQGPRLIKPGHLASCYYYVDHSLNVRARHCNAIGIVLSIHINNH